MQSAPPVFLHTGWRTAGTWLWSLYRALPQSMAFYEPVHESLDTLNSWQLPILRPDLWRSAHPGSQSYFDEFAPLLRQGIPGVAGFDIAFALEQFFATAGDALPEPARYLQSLIDLARSAGKQPVLKLARSLGRLGWMRQAFPDAAHVLMVRNPWSQWLSGWRLFTLHHSEYFLVMPLVILSMHRAHPQISLLNERWGLQLESLEASSLHARYERCTNVVFEYDPDYLYRAFLALWTITLIDAIRQADVLIDLERLALEPPYRERIERRLAGLTGLSVCLESVRLDRHPIDDELLDSGFTPRRCHELALEACAGLAREGERSGALPLATISAKLHGASGAIRTERSDGATRVPRAGPWHDRACDASQRDR